MSNLTLAEYHRHPAWSPTALKAAATVPRRFYWRAKDLAYDLQTGLQRREEAFQRIAACQASGIWPSHGRHAFRPAPSSFSFPEREELDQDSIALF